MPESRDQIEAALAAVAAFGLEHRSPKKVVEAMTDAQNAELLRRAEAHRVLGLLGAAVEAGHFEVTVPQRAALELELERWHAHALRIERLVLDATDVLTKAAIDHRVLKGVALAHTAYPSPEWRVFGDADLLVAPTSLGLAAKTIVEALDGARVQPELRPGFDDRFGKEVLVRVCELELDLHRTFVEGALGLTMDLGDLWTAPACFELGGTTLHALTPEGQVMHAAYAVAVGDDRPRLCAQRDLAQLLVVGRVARDPVLDLARRWRAEALLAFALRTTWASLALATEPPLITWANEHRTNRREQWLLAAHRGQARAYTRHLAAVGVLPGMRAKSAYVRAIAWPSRAYLEARGISRTGFLIRPLRGNPRVAK